MYLNTSAAPHIAVAGTSLPQSYKHKSPVGTGYPRQTNPPEGSGIYMAHHSFNQEELPHLPTEGCLFGLVT
jgi:hypothetical protein